MRRCKENVLSRYVRMKSIQLKQFFIIYTQKKTIGKRLGWWIFLFYITFFYDGISLLTYSNHVKTKSASFLWNYVLRYVFYEIKMTWQESEHVWNYSHTCHVKHLFFQNFVYHQKFGKIQGFCCSLDAHMGIFYKKQ